MKTFRGATPGCVYVLNTTLVEFKQHYTELANSPDKTPTASQLFPHVLQNGANVFRDVEVEPGKTMSAMVFDGIIYYETRNAEDTPPVPEKKPLKLQM